MIKKFFFIINFILLALNLIPCTLWSANGDDFVFKGGTLIAKNRDWLPNHREVLKLINPKSGFRYFGLFAEGNDEPGLKAGVNEKGLVVINSTAGSIPSRIRKNENRTKNLLSTLLKECDSVDAVLQKENLFFGSRNLMVADKTKTAIIEIGLNGKFSVNAIQNNIICHTNHYIDQSMLDFNIKTGVSSSTRFKRVEELLKNREKPFSLDDFIKISNDRNDGSDNSIYRTGKNKKSEKTVAVWIVYCAKDERSKIYIKINNPGEEKKIYRFNINDIFKMKTFNYKAFLKTCQTGF